MMRKVCPRDRTRDGSGLRRRGAYHQAAAGGGRYSSRRPPVNSDQADERHLGWAPASLMPFMSLTRSWKDSEETIGMPIQ